MCGRVIVSITGGSVGMADEQDSGSCVGLPRVGSSPIFRINTQGRECLLGHSLFYVQRKTTSFCYTYYPT